MSWIPTTWGARGYTCLGSRPLGGQGVIHVLDPDHLGGKGLYMSWIPRLSHNLGGKGLYMSCTCNELFNNNTFDGTIHGAVMHSNKITTQ